MRQLQIAPFLESLGWSKDQVRLAQTHIISRAVYPASKLETTRWISPVRIRERVAVEWFNPVPDRNIPIRVNELANINADAAVNATRIKIN